RLLCSPSPRPVPELTICRRIRDSFPCCGWRRASVPGGIAPRRCHNSRHLHSFSRRKRHRPAHLLPPRTSWPEGIGHRDDPGLPPVSANAALLRNFAEPPVRANIALPIQIAPRAAPGRPPFCTSRRLGNSPVGRAFYLRRCRLIPPARLHRPDRRLFLTRRWHHRHCCHAPPVSPTLPVRASPEVSPAPRLW